MALSIFIVAVFCLVDDQLSMSRELWLRFFYYLEGVHREAMFQRPLLDAPQGYLCSQRAHSSRRETPLLPSSSPSPPERAAPACSSVVRSLAS